MHWIDLDVIIDVDAGFFPLCKAETVRRQWLQSGSIQCFEEFGAGRVEFPKLPVIQFDQKFLNRFIQLDQAEEGSVPQHRKNPALYYQDSRFDFGLIPRLYGASRQYDSPIVI